MRENFLHYIWKHKKFETLNLQTSKEETVTLVSVGMHNFNSGPDFFNAQLIIDEQQWAGNVEIHIKSSDWYLHGHENDANYDNVILHVVWEHDTDVFRNDNTCIPTLELKKYVDATALHNYETLFSKTQKWINCENDFAEIDDFVLDNWLERLYFERLESKSEEIQDFLKCSAHNWEAILFKMLFKNFGLKVNGDSFLSIGNSFDFSIIRKLQPKLLTLEAIFFGQSGLLEEEIQDSYFLELVNEYHFLKQKFNLSNQGVAPLQFFRLRPPNFPTIRLSQFASLYHAHRNLFSKVIEAETVKEIYSLFSVGASSFWETHYTFNKTSKHTKKIVSKSFIDLLIINTIIPIKFSYAKMQGKDIDDVIVALIQQITSERNSIIDKFNTLKPVSKSALQSQALLQLKNEYCIKNKCMQCAIGNYILNK